MVIALYKGRSFASKVVRAFNWSEYSHVSCVRDPDGIYSPLSPRTTEIEAWKGGVTRQQGIGRGHTPGTPIDLFHVNMTDVQRGMAWTFLCEQVGKPYDWLGILGFALRADGLARRDKWFCSELVCAACQAAGAPLLERVPPHKVYPGMLAMSPRLRFERTIYASRF